MACIPNAVRAIVSSSVGNVQFTPAAEPVTYYEARVYAEGTTTPIRATKYLGKPSADVVTNLITVNLATTLNALPAGNYVVGVAAVGPGGTSESISVIAYVVPLQAA